MQERLTRWQHTASFRLICQASSRSLHLQKRRVVRFLTHFSINFLLIIDKKLSTASGPGHVLLNMRMGGDVALCGGTHCRFSALSTDGGASFSPAAPVPSLISSGVSTHQQPGAVCLCLGSSDRLDGWCFAVPRLDHAASTVESGSLHQPAHFYKSHERRVAELIKRWKDVASAQHY